MTWQIDEDEEFGGALLRWNDEVIAQTTGEESDGCIDAYDELVRAVRLYQSLPDAEHIHVTRHPDGTLSARRATDPLPTQIDGSADGAR